MPYLLTLLLLLLLVGCQSKEETSEKQPPTISSKSPPTTENIWGLSSYLDSIVANKTISSYRMQQPAWFAILLDIREDSIFSYGSILDLKAPLYAHKDTLATFKNFTGKWMLLQRGDSLLLQQFTQQHRPDATVYYYRQRNDLAFFTKNLDPVHYISTNITQYFNQKILAGHYRDITTKSPVHFHKNGQLEGYPPYTSYQIGVYFGTYHPYQNQDVVFFKRRADYSSTPLPLEI